MHILKIGGNELDSKDFLSRLAQYVAAQVAPVVIVHGGGRAIADLQARLGLPTIKVDGLRVTDADSLTVAEMVLSGLANKRLVTALLASGVDAVGLSGVDGGLLRCQKKAHPTADLGYVGQITAVRTDLITDLLARGITAVISPISLGSDNHPYNVNADEAAAAVALALQADLLDFVSNVPGVLENGRIFPHLTPAQCDSLRHNGVIQGGMIPKVQAALDAVVQGVAQARIVNMAGLLSNGGTWFSQEKI
jgi:acetylglutamate kinase